MAIFFLSLALFSSEPKIVIGGSFSILATQQINFVPLKKIDLKLYKKFPNRIDLKPIQSKVKSQGQRGACTYFTLNSLVESLIKKETGIELDLSEEFLAWAAKKQLKMRALEEDSSVAVNAATIQKFGYMLEKDLPYQQSWFDKGFPCAGWRRKPDVDSSCFSHAGPDDSKLIVIDKQFIFKEVGSSSLDVVTSLAALRAPVTISMLGHKEMWDQTYKTGDFYLTSKWKKDCQAKKKLCGGHALLAVGYDLDKRIVYLKNSWGEKWGNSGYGTITFDYLDQMSDRKFLTGVYKANVK